MAKGEAIPSKLTGIMNRIITEVKDPASTPICRLSKALDARRRIGLEMSGISAMASDDQARTLKKVR